METTIIAGIVLTCIGLLFIFNNKNISEGAFSFYQKLYTKKNLSIMFKILGIFLIVLGLTLILKLIWNKKIYNPKK